MATTPVTRGYGRGAKIVEGGYGQGEIVLASTVVVETATSAIDLGLYGNKRPFTLADQDTYGSGWEIGAYFFKVPSGLKKVFILK